MHYTFCTDSLRIFWIPNMAAEVTDLKTDIAQETHLLY
jgi:hypothetical protein